MRLLTEFKRLLRLFGLEYFGRYYAIYRGTVVDINDPTKSGRVKLKIPQVYGEDIHDYWAWPKGMMSGSNTGMLMLPAVGDGVYVTFENGDAKYPIWEHGWWADGEMIKAAESNYPDADVIQTRSGHRIEFDNKDEILRISHSNGVYAELNDFGLSLYRNDKKLSLGSLNGSDEPAVLGNRNGNLHTDHLSNLDDLCAQVQKLITAFQVTNPITVAEVTAQLIAIRAQNQALMQQVESTKSSNVTIDD